MLSSVQFSVRSENKKGKRRRGGNNRIGNEADGNKKHGCREGHSKIPSKLQNVTRKFV